MVRFFEQGELRNRQQPRTVAGPEAPEAPPVSAKVEVVEQTEALEQDRQAEPHVQYIEREITLGLLNQKLNELGELCAAIYQKVDEHDKATK